MKRLLIAAAVVLGTTSTFAMQQPPAQQPPAQAAAAPEQREQKAPEIALTGCLVQGSAPTVFVLENAKKDAKSDTEKGVSYIIVASSPDLNLRTHLNHEVTISGQGDGKTAPATGTKFEEKDLPKLTAKNVTMVSNTCALLAR